MHSSLVDNTIDTLLERYLGLVDEYVRLREHLARAQQDTLHALARARFTADRGAHFGPNQYDERMQASRRVVIAAKQRHRSPDPTSTAAETLPADLDIKPVVFTVATEKEEKAALFDGDASTNDNGGDRQEADGEETEKMKMEKNRQKQKQTEAAVRDPLRWFGLLVPQALREVQRHSVRAVEEIIPRLASVDAEMAQVEIEVRRARKRRAKAAAISVEKGRTSSTATV